MRTQSRKFLNDVKDSPSGTSAAAPRSIDYYNDTSPPLPRLPSTTTITTTTTTTTTTTDDGNNNSSSLNATITRKLGPPISATDSSMALTVAILLTALYLLGLFSVYIYYPNDRRRRRRRRHHRSQRYRNSSSGVDPSTIQSLPLFTYDGNLKETIDCSICLTEFEEKEMIKVIPFCGHFFHHQCIDMWLYAHDSCPLCRSTQLILPVPPHDVDPNDPSCFVAMECEVPLPLPPSIPSSSSSSALIRVNSFSSSSRLAERVLSLPRSLSF